MDIVSREQRSQMMAGIRGKDTRPELSVRRMVHSLGFRFRLHRRDLPGSPDLILPRHRKIIFVHGCFWHRHDGGKFATTPKSNAAFWVQKLENNRRRDEAANTLLASAGWSVLTVWECETRDEGALRDTLVEFLNSRDR